MGQAVSFGYTFNLSTQIGGDNTAFPLGTTGFILIDVLGDGFQADAMPSLLDGTHAAPIDTKIGADDVVMFNYGTVMDIGGANGFVKSFAGATQYNTVDLTNAPAIAGGEQIQLYWFPDGTSNISGGADRWGKYRRDIAGPSGGTDGFFFPPGGTVSIIAATTTIGGSVDPLDFQNAVMIIPEPASALLLLGGCGLLGFGRRRAR